MEVMQTAATNKQTEGTQIDGKGLGNWTPRMQDAGCRMQDVGRGSCSWSWSWNWRYRWSWTIYI